MFIIKKIRYVEIRFKQGGHHTVFSILEVKRSKILQKLNKRNCFCVHSVSFLMAFLPQRLIYTIRIWFNFAFGSFFEHDHLLTHGTIIRTGITCKKISCYMRDSAAGGLLLKKKLKSVEVMLNVFEFSRLWENAESSLVYANKLFWIAQPYFSTDIIKQS